MVEQRGASVFTMSCTSEHAASVRTPAIDEPNEDAEWGEFTMHTNLELEPRANNTVDHATVIPLGVDDDDDDNDMTTTSTSTRQQKDIALHARVRGVPRTLLNLLSLQVRVLEGSIRGGMGGQSTHAYPVFHPYF